MIVLVIAVDWRRYGELFEYDAGRGELLLETTDAASPAGSAAGTALRAAARATGRVADAPAS